ncbi:MAG: ASKHA domain-containing protein [Bacillota bacterium]
MNEASVTFLPGNVTIKVPSGSTVLDAARDAGIPVEAHCGGRGTCGKCRVLVRNTDQKPTSAERQALSREKSRSGWRLACQVRPGNVPLTVEVPVQDKPRLVKAGMSGAVCQSVNPPVKKFSLLLSPTDLEKPLGYWELLQESLAGRGIDAIPGLNVLRAMPGMLKDRPGHVTAVIYGDRIIALEQGDTVAEQYGLALDIGTTTVAGSIVDLRTGKELAAEADLNRQNQFGADIISRIDFSVASPAGLDKLTTLIRDVVNGIIKKLARRAGIRPDSIYAAAVAGNTCMLHLFAGISPGRLSVPPFNGIVHGSYTAGAYELGIGISPRAPVLFLPVISGYVGADTVGVILATGMHLSKKITLAIDIGTNGEIVLGCRNRLLACAAAAGPAFEGANISSGMRAAEGAIDRVVLDGDEVICSVIGGGKPRGICGSGLIDALAVMLEAGLIDSSGRLLEAEEAASVAGPRLASRIRQTERGREFLLSGGVAITQKDIRQVQLAKGAMRAGINILLARMGIGDSDIEAVLLAGSFGSYIDKAAARRLGIIPPVPLDRIRHVGNAAHQGAKMTLIDREVMDQAKDVCRMVEYVELSAWEDFSREFSEAMFFDPHPVGEN